MNCSAERVSDRTQVGVAAAIAALSALVAVTFIASTAMGVVKAFTPVPFWDMWDGYLNFYVRVTDGDYSAWWEQHVDHRIVFSRVFFWLDLRFFNGSTKLLIALNLTLALAIAGAFALLGRRILKHRLEQQVFAASSIAVSVAWIQRENLTWAFQSVMFASCLFPLLSALSLLRAQQAQGHARDSWFLTAAVLGCIAALTMKNGVAALPLLTALAMWIGIERRRSLILAFLSGIVILAFFAGAQNVVSSAQSGSAQLSPSHIWRIAVFSLSLLGAPALSPRAPQAFAPIVGALICLAVLAASIHSLRRKSLSPGQKVCIYLITYCLLTAAGIAYSRVERWGDAYAFTSRYMTNTLCLWLAAALLVYSSFFRERVGRSLSLAPALFLLMPTMLLPSQAAAFAVDHDSSPSRLVSALALELRVRDKDQIELVVPGYDVGLILAEQPAARNLSIFGNSVIRDSATLMGKQIKHVSASCQGGLDEILDIASDPSFVKVRGWAFDPYQKNYPTAWFVLDSTRRVVGFAIGGFSRADLTDIEDLPLRRSGGLVGYVKATALGGPFILKGRDADCEATVPASSVPVAQKRLLPVAFSDSNWSRGIAKNWGPGILVGLTSAKESNLRPGQILRFADGSTRTVSRLVVADNLVVVHLTGAVLDGERVGYPNSILVHD